ncbi:unnamed protein product [Microthlaspi erraticum]|uniref:Agenet domain-containing protein n=1 Tax=Microthlaspi erraticum TaxID=1685480 RepID=A0A6D2JGP8_9BRAS|nr:unnamed protein product [Microthlaspi erraticum]
MVEWSAKMNKTEPVWVPAMFIKEMKENDKTKYVVRFCNGNLGCKGIEARRNVTTEYLPTVRPRPPPFPVEELQSMVCVDVFHNGAWRQGRVTEILPRKWYTVRLHGSNNLELSTNLSNIRPSKVWKHGVWKSRGQGLVKKMCASMMNANESVTPSPGITATMADKTLARDQISLGKDKQDNTRKRKRDLPCVLLPFEKKLPIWKTFESMEVVKHLQPEDPISSLTSLSDSFAELEKYGFDVKRPVLRISKLLSLRDKQANKTEELKGAQNVTAEKESVKVENQRKILELHRLNQEVDKEIAQSKSCEAMIVQQLQRVKLQYQATASAPW